MTVSNQLLSAYKRDGFVIIREFVSAHERAEIQADIFGVFRRRAEVLGIAIPRGHERAQLTALLVALFRSSPKNYVAAAKLSQMLLPVHRLGSSKRMEHILEQFGLIAPSISTRPVIHYMADALRIEGGYHKTPPHQDWRSVQSSLDAVTLWSPLFDVGQDDYPVEVVPGSHRRGLLPSADHPFGHQVDPSVVDARAFEPVHLNAGDLMLFSAFLVHRTAERGGNEVRVALSYRYNNTAEPTFIERNYPDRYVYRAEKELLDPTFASAAHVAKIFAANDDTRN